MRDADGNELSDGDFVHVVDGIVEPWIVSGTFRRRGMFGGHCDVPNGERVECSPCNTFRNKDRAEAWLAVEKGRSHRLAPGGPCPDPSEAM